MSRNRGRGNIDRRRRSRDALVEADRALRSLHRDEWLELIAAARFRRGLPPLTDDQLDGLLSVVAAVLTVVVLGVWGIWG